MNKFKNYYRTVKYLESLAHHPFEKNKEIYLKRMRWFLGLIGNPEEGFKYIHVTGTAGKGTVSTMLANILHESGRKVGLFTSPYVTTSIEKIQVGDKYISPREFAGIVEYLKPYIEKSFSGPYGRITYFETFLAIAFLYFKEKQCEWVVLEVGVGGKYDATNVIENPLVTVITNIDYDHTHLLGRTLLQIASDKAGIIKKGSKFFTTEKRKNLLEFFKKVCEERKAEFHLVTSHSTAVHRQVTRGKDENEVLAGAIARSCGVSEGAIEKGKANTKLPARFETMQKNPQVIIDGAHNGSKMRDTVSKLAKLKFRKLILVMAIADNKDHEPILAEIIPLADYVFATSFKNPGRPSLDPEKLAKKANRFIKKGAKLETVEDSALALEKALKMADKDDLVLITGSFFLAGELRKKWHSEEEILERRRGL